MNSDYSIDFANNTHAHTHTQPTDGCHRCRYKRWKSGRPFVLKPNCGLTMRHIAASERARRGLGQCRNEHRVCVWVCGWMWAVGGWLESTRAFVSRITESEIGTVCFYLACDVCEARVWWIRCIIYLLYALDSKPAYVCHMWCVSLLCTICNLLAIPHISASESHALIYYSACTVIALEFNTSEGCLRAVSNICDHHACTLCTLFSKCVCICRKGYC